MIWDAHTHISGIAGNTPAARLENLLRYADRMGIERLCVSMGMKWSHDPTSDDLRRQNDDVLEAISKHPQRAFGFVYVNPNCAEASMAELERCVARGPMVGVKLWVACRCDRPELDPLVRRAEELRAPILQHTYLKRAGNLPGESTPAELAELARRHPKAVFLCGHTGADWERGIPAIRSCPNVYADLCGSDPTSGFTEMAVRELGAERVLFGSDAPGRSFASQLGKVLGAEISSNAKSLILGKNLARILHPILAAKGVSL